MIIWLLMIFDLVTLVMVTLAHFGNVFAPFLFSCAGYLFIKLFMFRDVMSGIDAVFGLYILIVALFHVSTFLYYFMLVWFLYKLVVTMIGS